MIHQKLHCLIIVLCCYCFYLSASDINLNFNKITLKDDLTSNRYNNYIFQDSRGFVWISSIDGLNRYDGMSIKTYGFESGMKDTNIQSDFFEDEKGNIWFSTYEAINCYNAKLDTIFNYQVTNFENEIVSKNYRAFHLEDNETRLWLLARNHIYLLDINSPEKFESLSLKTSTQFFNVGLNENGVVNKIVTYLNNDSVQFINPFDIEKSTKYPIPNRNKAVHLKDSKWLFYKNKQIIVFDEENPLDTQHLKNDAKAFISDLIFYNNDLLISTIKNGIWHYDWKEEKFLHQWKHKESNEFSLLTNKPRNQYISQTNYLWCSHRNFGVNYSYLFNSNFSNPLSTLAFEDVEITSVIETSDDNVWISTKYSGIVVLNSKNELLHKFNHPFPKPQNMSLLQLCKNEKEVVFGITPSSIFQLDLKNKQIKDIINKPDSLFFRYMNIVYPDRKFVSTNKGVIEIIKDTKDSYEIQYCSELSEYKEFSFLQMYQTQSNKVFIPYSANELWIYQATRDGLKLLAKNDTCNLEFFDFYESKKQPGIVWACTSKGLKIIDHKNNIKPVLSGNLKLANEKIYGIVEDEDSNLWLSTNKGLWKYNPNEPKSNPVQFNEVDGLSGELFSLYNSTLYASNGTIWLGNNKGLVKFHPDSITVHKEIPKMYLEELLINDTKPFKRSITKKNSLVLEPDQNTLTFDIKAVNLYKTKRNKIHYQLENYDDKWLQINNGEKIRYTKIKHGDYNLKVQAEDANGHLGKIETLLSIEIKSPFWKTWWFYVLCSILVALTLYSIIIWRENFIIKEEAKKTAIEKLKNQVLEVQMTALRAQMNPHFLFNSLNSIKSLILKTQEKEASTYLSKFSTLLRSILHNSEKQKIKLSEEIDALRLYIELEALRFASDFNYQIQIDKTIDSSFIRIPPLLLQPFVENAIWHGLLPKTSGDPKLNINIIRKEDFLFFEIEDNGVGRKKAATLPKTENRKSLGIDITKRRIKLLHEDNDMEIIDLVDNDKKPLGTKVIIKLFAPE